MRWKRISSCIIRLGRPPGHWGEREGEARFKMLTDMSEPAQAWGVAACHIEGIDVRALSNFLRRKYRIITVPLVGGAPPNQVFDYQALRISPNIYTTLEEIDTFIEAMEDAIKNGVEEDVFGPVASGSRAGEVLV